MLENAFDSQLNVESDGSEDSDQEESQPEIQNDNKIKPDSAISRWVEQSQIITEVVTSESIEPLTQDEDYTDKTGAIAQSLTVQFKIVEAEVNPDTEGDENHSEEGDELPELTGNQGIRPFRDEQQNVSAHVARNAERGRNAASIVSASTTTSVAPEVIRERVKRQFRSQEKIQQSRRIRKHGEAAVQTRKRRENTFDVQTSLDAGWY